MVRGTQKNALRCSVCGSRAFAIYGPTMKGATVECAECGAEIGRIEEFIAAVESELAKRKSRTRH